MLKRAFYFGVFAVGLAVLTGGLNAGGDKKDDKKYNTDTFVPTADEVIEKMFELATVKKGDFLFDLGCGDNRICYLAAKKFGCRGVGIETNPVRIRQAMDMFDKMNKDDALVYSSVKLPLVETRHGDALEAKDIGDATVVVMYMFPAFMELWFPIAKAKLKPGTRIVSHDYAWDWKAHPEMWEPTAIVENIKSVARDGHFGRDNHKVIMWVVPEKEKTKK